MNSCSKLYRCYVLCTLYLWNRFTSPYLPSIHLSPNLTRNVAVYLTNAVVQRNRKLFVFIFFPNGRRCMTNFALIKYLFLEERYTLLLHYTEESKNPRTQRLREFWNFWSVPTLVRTASREKPHIVIHPCIYFRFRRRRQSHANDKPLTNVHKALCLLHSSVSVWCMSTSLGRWFHSIRKSPISQTFRLQLTKWMKDCFKESPFFERAYYVLYSTPVVTSQYIICIFTSLFLLLIERNFAIMRQDLYKRHNRQYNVVVAGAFLLAVSIICLKKILQCCFRSDLQSPWE